MLTIRTFGGVALFLFGSTFLWINPAFASRGVSTEERCGRSPESSRSAMAAFRVATVGLFRRDSWWETVAVVSAVVGLVAIATFWIAASSSGETNPWWTALVLAVGCAGVLVLRVPRLEQWVDHHVMSG